MLKRITLVWLIAAWATQVFGQAVGTNSLLWKIEGNGLSKPSYIYGTMHSKKKQVYEFNHVVLDKITECDAFVGELALEPEMMAEAGKLFLLPEGKTLSSIIKKKDYEKASAIFKKETGMDLVMLDRLQPAYALMMMQNNDMINGEMKEALDQFLYNFAKNNGKQTGGLETYQEQAAAFNVLPLEKQVDYFVKGIKKYEADKAKVEAEKEKLVNLYLKTDVEAMAKMVDQQDESAMPKEMKDALVTKRNHIMANRFSDKIKNMPTFAAVGAAHLGGKEGIIALLRQKGFTVTAVPCAFDGTALKRIKDDTPQPQASSTSAARVQTGSATGLDVAVPAHAAAGAATTDNWVYYQSKEGGYAVYFPTKPSERTQQINNEQGQPITAYLVMVQEATTGKAFMVTYAETTEEVKNSPENDAKIRKQVEEQIKIMSGKITDEKDILMGGIKGKEYTIDVMGMVEMRVRKAQKGKKVYTLTTTYMKTDEVGKLEGNRFVESFSVN